MVFDLFVLLITIGAMYLGYKGGTSEELYRLGRVFLGMTIAGSYGTSFGWKLTSMGLLAANTKAIVTLVGFLLIFIIYWVITLAIQALFNNLDLKKSKLNKYLGMLASGVQALLIIIFVSFISSQLTFSKDNYKAYLRDSSFSYIYMDRICRKVITADIVDDITGAGTGKKIASEIIK